MDLSLQIGFGYGVSMTHDEKQFLKQHAAR